MVDFHGDFFVADFLEGFHQFAACKQRCPGKLFPPQGTHKTPPVPARQPNRQRFSNGKSIAMDWFKGKFTGKPHIEWENLLFPVKIFP